MVNDSLSSIINILSCRIKLYSSLQNVNIYSGNINLDVFYLIRLFLISYEYPTFVQFYLVGTEQLHELNFLIFRQIYII